MLVAHISDLHIGRDAATDRAAASVARAAEELGAPVVVVSGDVTHRGLLGELHRFEALFRRLLDAGRVVVVPGNHDRLGDDAAGTLMPGRRVATWTRPGLHVVRIDSTGSHNRWAVRSHGRLDPEDLAEVDAALDGAPPGAAVAAVLHHHVQPLPEDRLTERLASLVGLPYAAELEAGGDLLALLRGRCDVVMHGHRHRPADLLLDADRARPLRIVNPGCSTELRGFAALQLRRGGAGWAHRWIDTEPWAPVPGPWRPADGRAAA